MEVTGDSDTRALDQLCLLGFELADACLELTVVHVTHVHLTRHSLVVLVHNRVEKRSESVVRIRTSSVDADSRVRVSASRVNGLLESEAKSVLLFCELLPDIFAEVSAEETSSTVRECWEGVHRVGTWQISVTHGRSNEVPGRKQGHGRKIL